MNRLISSRSTIRGQKVDKKLFQEKTKGLFNERVKNLQTLALRMDNETHRLLKQRGKVLTGNLANASWTKVTGVGLKARLSYGYPAEGGKFPYAIVVDEGTKPYGKTSKGKRPAKRTGSAGSSVLVNAILSWVQQKGITFQRQVGGTFVPMTDIQTAFAIYGGFKERGVLGSKFQYVGTTGTKSKFKIHGNTITDSVIFKYRNLIEQGIGIKTRGRGATSR